MDIGMGLQHEDLQEEKESEDGERRKHSLYAIANTLKKLLTFFPSPNLGLDGTSRTKVKEFPGSFSYSGHPDNNGSSWTYRSYDNNGPGTGTGGLGPGTGTGTGLGPGPGPGKKSSFGLRRKNLKSGLHPSARSTSSSLFSRSTVLNNLMNNNISDDDGDGNGRTSRISRGYNNNGPRNMRPSLSLTTSFDFTSCELDLPGRPYDQTVSKSQGRREGGKSGGGLEGGNNWGLLSNVDC